MVFLFFFFFQSQFIPYLLFSPTHLIIFTFCKFPLRIWYPKSKFYMILKCIKKVSKTRKNHLNKNIYFHAHEVIIHLLRILQSFIFYRVIEITLTPINSPKDIDVIEVLFANHESCTTSSFVVEKQWSSQQRRQSMAHNALM